MEEKKLPIPKDFFKQFKNKEEFHTFFNSLFKEGVEEMLKGELDEHLGYEKHSKEGNNSGNSRNGFSSKKVKTESLGDMVLNIPRDRNSEFDPQLIPKGSRMSDKLEQAIVGMYSRGMTTSENQASLRITFKRKRTIPITSKTWIMPPAWYPKNPIAQLMIKITAMM